jgi:hypothetical protein
MLVGPGCLSQIFNDGRTVCNNPDCALNGQEVEALDTKADD